MPDFSETLTTIFALLAVVAMVALGASVFRLLRPRVRVTDPSVPAGVRALKAVSAAGVLLVVLGVLYATHVLLPMAPLAASWSRILFFALLAGWGIVELVLAASVPAAHAEGSVWRTALLAAGTGVALLAAGYFLRSAPAALSYPAPAESVALAPPFEGTWLVIHGGASGATNHHARLADQRFAADIAHLGPDGRLRRGLTDGLEDFYTFGAPIYAPVDGVVASIVDGLPDDQRPDVYEDIAGNHVAIAVAADRYVMLAHLQRGSVAVIAGQRVQRGQLIGRAGNSGNSDFPHLHLQVQDRPDISPEAIAHPYHFVDFERKRWIGWRRVAASGLLRNDLVRAQPPPVRPGAPLAALAE